MADNSIEDLKAPLLAAVGAADLALATVNEILLKLRERAEFAGDRVEDRRAALTKLQERLPRNADDIRDRLSPDELRRAAEEFRGDATETYNSLIERGEAAIERLMGQADFKEAAGRVEGYVDQAVELTQDALGSVSAQTRAVGERAAKLVGVDLPAKKAPARAVKKAVKKAPAKRVVKKAPTKKAVKKAVKKAPVKRVVKKAPTKKAIKRAVKKAVRRTPAKRVTQK